MRYCITSSPVTLLLVGAWCLVQQQRSIFPLFQDNVLNIINQIMDVCIPQDRAPRDFCVKFPEEIRHDNLAGQLWFGAEVAAATWARVTALALPSRCSLRPGQPRGKALTWRLVLLWAGWGRDGWPTSWGRVGPPAGLSLGSHENICDLGRDCSELRETRGAGA